MAAVPNVVSSENPTRILVAVSQSSVTGYPNMSVSTERAYRWVLDKIARANPTCFHLTFIHVLPPGIPNTGCIPVNPYRQLNTTSEDEGERMEQAAIFLDQFVTECNNLQIPCDRRTVSGEPAKVICREAKNDAPELLVLGRRGLGSPDRLCQSSVSKYCVKNAECPVVAIKCRPQDIPANYGAADD